MRTQYVSHTLVTYPEQIAWLNDTNVIVLESSDKVGATITITTPTFEVKTLTYFSELNKLTFTLDEILLALYNENTSAWNVDIALYENSLPAGSLGFAINVYNGKSFISRSHGMQSVYYVYSPDELIKLNVYSPRNGVAICGQYSFYCYEGLNSYNLSSVIQNEGEYTLRLQGSNQTPPTAIVVSAENITPTTADVIFTYTPGFDPDTTYGGDLWFEGQQIFPVNKKIIYQTHCDSYNFIELRYTDTDGCTRFLGGKVMEETDDANDEAFNKLNTNIWRHNPSRWIKSSSKSVKIGFHDIEKEAYPQDILYSDTIYARAWDGEWQEVRLKTTSLTQNDDETSDFEIEIYMHEV